MIKNLIQEASSLSRVQSRIAIFNQKRFWDAVDVQEQQMDVEDNVDEKTRQQFALRRYCKQFQQLDYLTQPVDLSDYYIRSVPIGSRCFVTSSKGSTTIRSISGDKIEFESSLPGGSRRNSQGRCILDCYLVHDILYIFDIIQYGRVDLSEQVAEMRYFWIQGNILTAISGDYQFKWIPVLDQNNLLIQPDFQRQGIALIKKDSYYCRGLNPECFIYKDARVDNTFNEQKQKAFTMTLILHKSTLLSLDEIQVALWPSCSPHKQLVEVTFENQKAVKVDPSRNHIEEPYSKLRFWSQNFEFIMNNQ